MYIKGMEIHKCINGDFKEENINFKKTKMFRAVIEKKFQYLKEI